MSRAIEQLSVNSWKSAAITGSWSAVSLELFGMYRLCLWMGDEDAANLADFLSSLATFRRGVK